MLTIVKMAHWLVWVKWLIWLIGPGYSDKLLVFGIFWPEAKKAVPGRKASKHTPGVNSGSKKTLPL
jgi:hypothetical protein